MKVAVTAREASMDAAVDPRFGRAPVFVLVDLDTMEMTTIDNAASLDAAQGAGIQAAQAVVRAGAAAVLTGHCGPKAFRVLSAAGVRVCTGADGVVSEVLQRFRDGTLTAAAASDVAGHWA